MANSTGTVSDEQAIRICNVFGSFLARGRLSEEKVDDSYTDDEEQLLEEEIEEFLCHQESESGDGDENGGQASNDDQEDDVWQRMTNFLLHFVEDHLEIAEDTPALLGRALLGKYFPHVRHPDDCQ